MKVYLFQFEFNNKLHGQRRSIFVLEILIDELLGLVVAIFLLSKMKFVILFALLAIAKCQYVQDGNCPDVHVLHNLDRDKVTYLKFIYFLLTTSYD